ncbi:envelope glycoprotein [Simian immunodeficiency virus]|uniref:Envelope glycoprotein gp160 n=2 Tax=Simian immunodeficiency virus TaxID=11723 RepID=I3VKV6_SIV|nr:envelope glycoprotein [Simian immunodeficiency virus]UYP40504.1 envelope glycoprotein [synthetic construct]
MKNSSGLILTLITTILGIGFSTYYATVFYGVPVWKDATPPLFCASDADVASTQAHNIWATHNCVPLDPHPYEVPLPNVSIEFDMSTNYMVEEMKTDLISLFQQSFKPCVKLTPFCIRMTCANVTEATTTTPPTTSTSTTEPPTSKTTVNTSEIEDYKVLNCSFNQTTEFRDKKKNIYSLFYREDVMKESQNKTNNSEYYYLHNCNTTAITQSCSKSSFEPIPIRYCAPAGYAMLKCNDANFTGAGECTNVSVVHCTHGIMPMIASWLHLNGTYEKEKTKVYHTNVTNNPPLLVKFNETIHITCERTGNNTRGQVQIGPGMTFYNRENIFGDTRKAFCYVNATEWRRTLEMAKTALREATKKPTLNITRPKGDPEVENFWFNCQGEFFYCNLTKWINETWLNETDQTNLVAPCRLRQIVNHWGIVAKAIYLPPRRGTVKCVSNITGFLMTNEETGATFSGKVEDYWRVELAKYKIVEIQPLSVAPTTGKRPEIKANHTRSKRDVGIGLLFLGFLSAAGSTMGAASIALVAQARGVLSGIVQQQHNLLQAIEAQQHLLQLTVWGVKQLQARLLAMEKYIRDQQLLSVWGCANKLVCHSTVVWNDTWAARKPCSNTSGPTDYDCIWQNLTWQQWSELVDNSTDTIYTLLEVAQIQQEKNKKELLELDKWSTLWDWFDITQWLWYIKLAIIIIAGLIGLRILMFIVNVLRQVRQGYMPLFSQIPTQAEQDPEQPGGIAEGGGDRGRIRWTPSPRGFFSIVWEDLRNLLLWIYQTCLNFVWLLGTILQALKQGTISFIQTIIIVHRNLVLKWRLFRDWLANAYVIVKTSFIRNLDRLANFTAWWTDILIEGAVNIFRGIRNIPTRIRQGLEIALN